MTENRRLYRRRMSGPVAIYDLDGRHVVPCHLHDISEDGAQLFLGSTGDNSRVDIPEQFILAFTLSGNVRRLCHLVWRDNGRMGVRFDAKHD